MRRPLAFLPVRSSHQIANISEAAFIAESVSRVLHRKCPKDIIVKLASSFLVCHFLCCSTAIAQKVTVKYLPDADFTKFHTYDWTRISHAETVDEEVDQIVQRGVDARMSEKHFTKVDGKSPDIHLVCQIAVKHAKQWAGLDPNITTYDAMANSPREEMAIDIGTLVLDVYDSTSSKLLWHGKAKKTFYEEDDAADRGKGINKAIAELMEKFPPKK